MILRHLRPRWLDLLLVAALASLLLLLEKPPAESQAWASLWPNATTDLAFTWLAARIIDGLARARSARQEALGFWRGAMNYTAGIATDLAPHFDYWRLRDLENEVRSARLLLSRTKNLRRDERERLLFGVSLAEKVLIGARAARAQKLLCRDFGNTRWETNRLARSIDRSAADGLRDHVETYFREADADAPSVRLEIADLRRRIESATGDPEGLEVLQRYATAAELAVNHTEEVKANAARLLDLTRQNEIALLERIKN